MAKHRGTIKEVRVSRNTISVVAKFNSYRGDARLFADGVEVHPLVFNPEDRLHYSMIWRPEGTTINKLEALDTIVEAEGSWTTLTTPKTRPTRADTLVVSPGGSGDEFSDANPGDLLSAVELAVEQGDTEIVLKAGVYKQTTADPSGYMAIFQRQDEQRFDGISIVSESPRKAIISNLLEDDGFTTTLVDEESSTYTIQGVPRPIVQLHVVVHGKIERLQERFGAGTDWTEETLKASSIGGWFVDPITDQFFVKLPDGADPSGKLRISDSKHERAWLFSGGADLWIDGVVFEYWLNKLGASGVHLGSSMIFQDCQQVVVRNCKSRYTLDYSLHFSSCTDYLVEACDFVDGQTFTTYITMRVGRARFGGAVRNYNSELGTIRNSRWRQCFVATQFTSSRLFEVFTLCDLSNQHIEFHHNYLYQARDVPIMVVGNGGQHAIWANILDTCGLAMPNVEQGSPISPVYWINNLATDAGYFGVFFDDGTKRTIKGNRFGGSRSPRIGRYFYYYNTLRNEWFPPNGEGAGTIQRIHAWQAGSKDHSGSRYYNNIFTSSFREIGSSSAGARSIWFHEGIDADGNRCLHMLNLCRMQWDHNQYFWNKTDANDNPTDEDAFNLNGQLKTFTQLQEWVDATLGHEWEPHGAFQDPKFDAESHPAQAISAMHIPGITDNEVLGMPGNASGSTATLE